MIQALRFRVRPMLRLVMLRSADFVRVRLWAYARGGAAAHDQDAGLLARALMHQLVRDLHCIGLRILRKLLPKYNADVDRAAIIDYVGSEGRMTSRFSFMVVVSCGVATMGLLQSSPAVVIGAMLISPLMSPIMALGFSLCVMDFKLLRKSLEALVIGTFMAIIISFILVSLSPLNDPTPEILARTSPNLLDLVIAIFSALAGGYAVIKRKGETLVGVAIATALMPPLAVVGYGLATGKAAVASGSFFLFMTNLLAIALTVTLLAKWYGFDHRQGRHLGKWQVPIVLLVFVVLSIPLGGALRHIAYETVTTRTAKGIISDYFAKGDVPARIELFHIAFGKDDNLRIETVILTQHYIKKARENILEKLEVALDRKVTLSLDQLVVSQDPENAQVLAAQVVQNTLSAPTAEIAPATKTASDLEKLRAALPVEGEVIAMTDASSTFEVRPKPIDGYDFARYRTIEETLASQFPELTVRVVPPSLPLPTISFAAGATKPDARGRDALRDSIWALERWSVQDVQLVGFLNAPSGANTPPNAMLVEQRTKAVMADIEQSGLHPVVVTEYLTKEMRRAGTLTPAQRFQYIELRVLSESESSHNGRNIPNDE